ncbi:MAG: PDZ domain-containing protein [Nitrospirae bacterium]|nr:PDZ domain-containing protein [Nitrospirota bacterium]
MNQRYYTIINGALIALSAYFAADIVNSIIEKKIEAVPAVIANTEKGQALLPKRDINSYSVIFEKNLFGSEYPKARTEGDAPARPAANIKLIGTVAGGSDSSYAIIEENNEQAVYKLNQKIADGSMIIKVSYKGITLKTTDGSKKEIPVFEDTNIVEIKSQNKGPSPNVRKVSDSSFIVDQREVANSLENMNQLLTQARVAPIIDNGKTTGFRIFEIKPNSLYEKIGLSNGDVVQRINGVEIDDPNKFFQTYQNLKDEKSISVDIVRNGAKQTLSYEIR